MLLPENKENGLLLMSFTCGHMELWGCYHIVRLYWTYSEFFLKVGSAVYPTGFKFWPLHLMFDYDHIQVQFSHKNGNTPK